jgi:aminoglycoside/choline kinase family phosphotransferase
MLRLAIEQKLSIYLDRRDFFVFPIIQDGSSRQYYRILSSEKKYILMMLNSQSEIDLLKNNQYDWISIRDVLYQENILCPFVYELFKEDGALLIEDLGNEDLSSFLCDKQNDINETFQKVFPIIVSFLGIKKTNADVWCLRSFDQKKLYEELIFFYENFLKRRLFKRFSLKEENFFLKECLDLSSYLSLSSEFFVHRDFHSRNLMLKNNKIYVIDFQDARLGHPAYDLVSLCFDSYLSIDIRTRLECMNQFLKFFPNQKIEEEWPIVLLHRQLKALGSFAYLTDVRGRDYLKYIPESLKILKIENIKTLKRWPILSNYIFDFFKHG